MKNKTIKTVFICIFCLILSFSAFIICTHIGVDKIVAYFSRFVYDDHFSEQTPMSTYYYAKLNDKEKSAYITVFNEIRNHPEYIKIPELTNEEFNNVFFAVKNDNPDLLCFADRCNMISFWSASFIQLTYSNDVSECENMMSEMSAVADMMISEIKSENFFEKELIIHDRMLNHCDYEETENSSNAYGFFIEKKAVCSGYSRAAMILFNKAGIESFVITGTGISPVEGEVSHMWNIVIIDGIPYHIDVTWDDPISDSDDFMSHMYFNLTDDRIAVDHADYSCELSCTNSEYNYFVYNGTSYSEYNKKIVADISQKLIDNIRNGYNYFEFEFTGDDAYFTALDSMVNNSSLSSDMYTIMNIIASDPSVDIDTSHVNFSMDDSRRYIRLSFDTTQK